MELFWLFRKMSWNVPILVVLSNVSQTVAQKSGGVVMAAPIRAVKLKTHNEIPF